MKKKTLKIVDPFASSWEDLDTQLMVMAAHRYCLGRQSYIVSSALSWLWKHRKSFERNTIRVIVRDTIEAIMKDQAGEVCDTEGWRHLASKLYAEMLDEDKQWIRSQVNHHNKDWPLVEFSNE